MAITPIDCYKNSSTHALAGFQLIEQGLKDYLSLYYKTVNIMIDSRLQFGFVEDDLSNWNLEKLMKFFPKTTNNNELVARIRKLTDKRNDLAHRAFSQLYGEVKTNKFYLDASKNYEEVAKEIGVLLQMIQDETVRIYLVKKTLQQ